MAKGHGGRSLESPTVVIHRRPMFQTIELRGDRLMLGNLAPTATDIVLSPTCAEIVE